MDARMINPYKVNVNIANGLVLMNSQIMCLFIIAQ